MPSKKLTTPILANKTLLVLGATSDIAIATLNLLAQEGWDFYLAGRDEQALAALAEKLQQQYNVQATFSRFDTAMDVTEQEAFWQEVLRTTTPSIESEQNSTLAGLFCAVGYLGIPHQAEHNLKEGMLIVQSNFSGLIPIISLAANYFEQRRNGLMVVISSVAGDRGRASNYPYGSAKAGMTAYLSGLRARLARSKVHVMTVLPGFVDTRMLSYRSKTPYLCASVEEVAQDIIRGIHKRRSVVYSKWYWRYIMFGVKHMPEWMFKKITL